VRSVLARLFGEVAAEAVRIQYGVSMKPSYSAELLAQPDIDGGLIGGASLVVDDFVAIAAAATPRG
jgi:triosephosphate isomerase (TIM)